MQASDFCAWRTDRVNEQILIREGILRVNRTNSVSGMYSYLLNVSREFSLKAALQATYTQKKLDWDKLTFGDMIDPRYDFIYQTQETRPNETRSYVDLSTGIVGYTSVFYGGVAVHHLTEPDEAFIVDGSSPLPRKITGHFGALIPIGNSRYSETNISPNVIYMQQAASQYLNLGMYVQKSAIVGGLWYRANLGTEQKSVASESVIALVGLQQGIFKIGYSYDLTLSELGNSPGGSHEISLGLQFECRPKKKRFRTISCPSF